MMVQGLRDNVKFVTNEDSNYQVLNYHKFKNFISQFRILDTFDFNKNLDSFQTIFLDCITGKWNVEKPEVKESSFDKMLKLNLGKQEIDEEKKKKDPVLKNKAFLDYFFKQRKDQAIKNQSWTKK